MRPSPKALFSLAQAEEQLGEMASAQASYEEARSSAEVAGEVEVVGAAAAAEAALEPRVPHLRVVVMGAADATATLDGRPFATSLVVAVDPGVHELKVRAADGVSASVEVDLKERQQLELPVRLDAREPAPRAAPSPGQGPSSVALTPTRSPTPEQAEGMPRVGFPWATVGLASSGVGILALGLATYFGVEARARNDDSYGAGCVGRSCPSAGYALRMDALTDGRASTALFVAGGALVAAGVVTWVVAPRSSSRAAASSALSVGLYGPTVALRGAW